MKRHPLVALAALIVSSGVALAGLDAYDGDYEGSLDVRTGKKNRAIAAEAFVFAYEPEEPAEFYLSAFGSKGQEVEIEILLNPDGSASLLVEGTVSADPKFLIKPKGKGHKGEKGKKVRIVIRAGGTYTLGEDGVTVAMNLSGNQGKSGANVTGLITLSETGKLSVTLNSGFKQKVNGLGRRVGISFAGDRLLDEDFGDE